MNDVSQAVADQLFVERGDFQRQVEAVQRVLEYLEDDLENGVPVGNDGYRSRHLRPSAADVIDKVRFAISHPTDVSTRRK